MSFFGLFRRASTAPVARDRLERGDNFSTLEIDVEVPSLAKTNKAA
jgi:hypothetical protein